MRNTVQLRRISVGLFAVVCFAHAAMGGHPVSLTRSFVYVTRDRVTAKVESFLEDLVLFHNVKPDDQDFLDTDVISKGIELHQAFLLDKFAIRDVEGRQLVGRAIDVEKSHLPAEGVGLGELMAHQLVFEFEYELPTQPEFLTFSQHFVDSEGTVPAEMHLFVQQENAAKPFTATLMPDEPESYRFSWNLPPLSDEASAEAWREWNKERKEETLGITSYSSVYSFLYVEDDEVRHEILVPLLSLEESILIARDDDPFLDLAEQDAARQQIEEYFKTGNPIDIDDENVQPTVARCDFFGLDIKDFAKQAERRTVSLVNARVGIILSYATKQPPDRVLLTWNRFNNYIRGVNMVVYAGADASKTKLSRVGNTTVYEWHSPGRRTTLPPEPVRIEAPQRSTWSVPIVSIVCLALLLPVVGFLRTRRASLPKHLVAVVVLGVGAALAWPHARLETPSPFAPLPQVSDERAESIFGALHKNTYRAFDFRTENKVYDALAVSVDGDLLDDLYLQIRRGLQMQEQGGAISRIREVSVLEGRKENLDDLPQDGRSFGYHCRWSVSGTVEHWGHIHSRTNEYVARFAVEPRGESWRITKVDLLDEKPLSYDTSVRGL